MQSRTHLYIYDEFLTDRKYERMLSELEGHLSSLDLQGPIVRLSPLRGTKDSVQALVRDGIRTIVVVGDDATFDRVISFLPDFQLPIGYIPMRSPAKLGERFGIRQGILACDVLAARHIDAIDLAKMDEAYFLMGLHLEKTTAALVIPEQYRMHSALGADIDILNVGGDPKDGLLEIVFRPKAETARSWTGRLKEAAETRLFLSDIWIEHTQPQQVAIDHHTVQSAKFRVQILPQALRFITGRQGIAKSR